jgi:hypothetical protein
VANNSLKGADVDEAFCPPTQSKGISVVRRENEGTYCVIAPGIDSNETPAAVTVDLAGGTGGSSGDMFARTWEDAGCGAGGDGFEIRTAQQGVGQVDANGGTNNATAARPSLPSNDVAFTIVIP